MGGKERMRTEIAARQKVIPKLVTAMLADAGHMLHHDQPEALAQMIEQFLLSGEI